MESIEGIIQQISSGQFSIQPLPTMSSSINNQDNNLPGPSNVTMLPQTNVSQSSNTTDLSPEIHDFDIDEASMRFEEEFVSRVYYNDV